MSRENPCKDCPNLERRQGERRKAIRSTMAHCAKFIAFVTVFTSLLSVGAAVTISSVIAQKVQREHQWEMEELRQWAKSNENRIADLENK